MGTLNINGDELFLDTDVDTSITADTDDQIDFKTGGTDAMHIGGTSGSNRYKHREKRCAVDNS